MPRVVAEIEAIGFPGPVGPTGPQGPQGTVAVATNAETITGTNTTKAVTPAGLEYERPYFDVRTYGAIGNGTADDTAAIQAAINACAAAGGGEVRLPTGSFAISAPITVSADVSLWGVGSGWGKLHGSVRPLSIIRCTTATAKIVVQGGGGTFGHFTIDGGFVADGPLLHRSDVGAKRLFQSIFLARSNLEAWRIDFAQNDVHVDISMFWHGGAGLTLDKGAGGLSFYGCEFAGCTTWNLIVDETDGTGPYSSPSHNTFDHCLFEFSNALGANTLQGCVWIKTGKRTVFRDCAANPSVAASVGVIKIDGTAMGADPIVTFDGCWIASAVAGGTGIIQEAGLVLLSGSTEFTGLLNAWRFNGGSAQIAGPITYSGTTNHWDPASTASIGSLVLATNNRPLNVRAESTDFFLFRGYQYGDTASRLDIDPTGRIWWGPGNAALDCNLARSSAGVLRTDKLWLNTEIEIDGALNHDGTTVGFYGTTPVTKPTGVTAAAALTALGLATATESSGLSGTGSPEGVVTATVGTAYTDTAATNGAIAWIKASGVGNTGWAVTFGDTGTRQITSWDTAGVITGTALAAGWKPRTGWAGYIRVRRHNDTIVFAIFQLAAAVVNTNDPIWVAPSGFQAFPSTTVPGGVAHGFSSGNTTKPYYLINNTGNIGVRSSIAIAVDDYIVNGYEWSTSQMWPTSLPGIAV